MTPLDAALRVRILNDCWHPLLPSEPTGYLAWHEWAEKKSKTHHQEQCPKCGLYLIWKSGSAVPS